MYSESMDWKLATMVVIKGCPATLARTLRSFRTCSTCFKRITETWPLAIAAESFPSAAHTVNLAQDFEGKDFVLVFALCIFQTYEPYARKCAWYVVSDAVPQ